MGWWREIGFGNEIAGLGHGGGLRQRVELGRKLLKIPGIFWNYFSAATTTTTTTCQKKYGQFPEFLEFSGIYKNYFF